MTSLDGINGRSIQTLLRGENDSKQSDEIQASYVCLWRDFCQPACSFAPRLTLKTALNSHEQCNEFADLLFWRPSLWIILPFERLFVLGDSIIISLYFIKVYIFIPLIHSPPFLSFSHILLTRIFSDVYYHAECFSYPWWCRWSAKARNLILIFNFSSQRLHLNYILLSNSNVCSFECP